MNCILVLLFVAGGGVLCNREQTHEAPKAQNGVHREQAVAPEMYLRSNVPKQAVPVEKRSWEVDFPEYAPHDYTAPIVLKEPRWPWADPTDPGVCAFNQFDGNFRVDRVSYHGHYNISSDGRPLNPMGRTGVRGRGLLGRWGVNHVADPAVTRFHKGQLQIVMIKRGDTGRWALPGGFRDAGESLERTFEREFTEEALGGVPSQRLEEAGFWLSGKALFRGQLVGDPRSTDNAWTESKLVNFHDSTGLFDDIKLVGADDAVDARWTVVDSELIRHSHHKNFIRTVAKLHGKTI